MATTIGIWDSLSPEAQAKLTASETVTQPVQQPKEETNEESDVARDAKTRILFDQSNGELKEVIATVFGLEDTSTRAGDGDSREAWENLSACSSKGVPLSKEELREIFGGMSYGEIFGDADLEEGLDFRYQGRSIRHVHVTNLQVSVWLSNCSTLVLNRFLVKCWKIC